ncbi:PDZ domain-containing protein [Chengkuizengella marina]|uniref:PDZ domain-containing protein n=1 Tax=Chengkuizengella marina TaxID=2507566 RepID=A0A6N9Q4S4_9BACL|nr:PDZ domain-containing protein [Chengkuizengella marina]NBI29836.1 PDZ domain-containing protein [Chengkuizengella marina]
MINSELNKTINIIHIESSIEKVWRGIALPDGSNAYLSDKAQTTGDPQNPQPGDVFHFIYGDIENESKCVESEFPTRFRLLDQYQSMLPDGTLVPYNLDTTFKLKQMDEMVELTVEVTGYGEEPHDLWIRECMETGWRRSLINLKCVLELGLDLRNELFGYPRIGVNNTGVSDYYSATYNLELGKGNYILECFPGGPAYEAGIRKGDVVTTISDQPVNNYCEFVMELSKSYSTKKEIHIEYLRNGQMHTAILNPTYDDRFTGLIDPNTNSEDLIEIRKQRKETRLNK